MTPLKIVVIGGTGRVGKKLVEKLQLQGMEVLAASPSRGVNALTGEGLAEALAGCQVVVDVSNAPMFEDHAVMAFFETGTRNLLAAEQTAGVKHHVALSVVGTDRLLSSGYFRAKMAQEKLIRASSIPYTIVRATQFFEFLSAIAEAGASDGQIQMSPAMLQPIASEDVAAELAKIAVAAPLNSMVEVAGPQRLRMDELVRQYLQTKRDSRPVITSTESTYFGTPVDDTSLTAAPNALLGPTTFAAWLAGEAAEERPIK